MRGLFWQNGPMQTGTVEEGRAAALRVLKELRRVDMRCGVKNSRIAFDIAMAFYEAGTEQAPASLSVDQIAEVTRLSGPTVRLVLKRLSQTGTIAPGPRLGKTQFYVMTERGHRDFSAYITVLCEFRNGALVSAF